MTIKLSGRNTDQVAVCRHFGRLAIERLEAQGVVFDGVQPLRCIIVFRRNSGRIEGVGSWAGPSVVACDANGPRSLGCQAQPFRRCPERWMHENSMLIRHLRDIRK